MGVGAVCRYYTAGNENQTSVSTDLDLLALEPSVEMSDILG